MSAPLTVRVDGAVTGVLDALDRGLHYGDGLFETIACRTGAPRFLDLHLERLTHGCARLAIQLPDLARLAAQIRELAATRPACLIKLIVTRGSATARGYGAHGDERSRTLLLQYEWPPQDPACWAQGVNVRTATGRLGENPALAGIKHLNRLEQVLIRGEWTDPEILEALVFSSSGWLVSGTMSNVFLVGEGRIMTPAITGAGVRGVMRRVVMREAQRAGFAVIETTLDAAALAAAEELFLTNARMGIWPVRSLDGAARTVGPVTRQLQQSLLPLLERPHA
jgi:4-amino-4-deoxychorismate lyase